jgi:sterol desaturase/sphingolipid hydroxylase (fatty acid hydroxylase superfamily)
MAVIVGTAIFGDLIGYTVHRLAHHPRAGIIHKAHMNHHNQQYPPTDYLSDTYRTAGNDSFTLYFIPVFLAFGACAWFVLPWHLALLSLATISIVSYLNDRCHSETHLKGSKLLRFRWFRRLRDLHYEHHVDHKSNFGIFSFNCDMLFGTWRNRGSVEDFSDPKVNQSPTESPTEPIQQQL